MAPVTTSPLRSPNFFTMDSDTYASSEPGQVAGGADEGVVVQHVEDAVDRRQDVVIGDHRLGLVTVHAAATGGPTAPAVLPVAAAAPTAAATAAVLVQVVAVVVAAVVVAAVVVAPVVCRLSAAVVVAAVVAGPVLPVAVVAGRRLLVRCRRRLSLAAVVTAAVGCHRSGRWFPAVSALVATALAVAARSLAVCCSHGSRRCSPVLLLPAARAPAAHEPAPVRGSDARRAAGARPARAPGGVPAAAARAAPVAAPAPPARSAGRSAVWVAVSSVGWLSRGAPALAAATRCSLRRCRRLELSRSPPPEPPDWAARMASISWLLRMPPALTPKRLRELLQLGQHHGVQTGALAPTTVSRLCGRGGLRFGDVCHGCPFGVGDARPVQIHNRAGRWFAGVRLVVFVGPLTTTGTDAVGSSVDGRMRHLRRAGPVGAWPERYTDRRSGSDAVHRSAVRKASTIAKELDTTTGCEPRSWSNHRLDGGLFPRRTRAPLTDATAADARTDRPPAPSPAPARPSSWSAEPSTSTVGPAPLITAASPADRSSVISSDDRGMADLRYSWCSQSRVASQSRSAGRRRLHQQRGPGGVRGGVHVRDPVRQQGPSRVGRHGCGGMKAATAEVGSHPSLHHRDTVAAFVREHEAAVGRRRDVVGMALDRRRVPQRPGRVGFPAGECSGGQQPGHDGRRGRAEAASVRDGVVALEPETGDRLSRSARPSSAERTIRWVSSRGT